MFRVDIPVDSDEDLSVTQGLMKQPAIKPARAWRVAPDFPDDPHQPKELKQTGPAKAFTEISLIDHVRFHGNRMASILLLMMVNPPFVTKRFYKKH